MKLTYDTLLYIISTSWYAEDMVQLTATCRVLYHQGPKIALKKPVIISTPKQLASFLKFLHADNSSRGRYLRQLELWSCSLEPDIVQDLMETLPLLTNIEYLRLIEADQVLELHPALTPAFCALTTLRHIDFNGVKNKTCELLARLQAPLISASIDFLSSNGQKLWHSLDEDDWNQFHPTTLLKNFASTLEELQCISWYTTPSEAVVPTEVYPNMRKLSIDVHYFPLWMDPFIRTFPNLTDLHVNTEYNGGDVNRSNWEVMEDSHTINVAQQRGVNSESCGTWAHLEHFCGYLLDLYAIGLTSHIPRVTLEGTLDDDADDTQTEMLATMLCYVRPLYLKLESITGAFLGDADRGFIPMLRDAGASNVVNLDVSVRFFEDDRERDLSIVIASLISALTGLPLQFLNLVFVTSDLNPTRPQQTAIDFKTFQQNSLPEPPALTPAPLTPAELSLQSLDMDALIARLESMPSLQAAHVVVYSSRWRGDGQWTGHDRTITKGGARLAGHGEQWENWTPGKNEFVFVRGRSV